MKEEKRIFLTDLWVFVKSPTYKSHSGQLKAVDKVKSIGLLFLLDWVISISMMMLLTWLRDAMTLPVYKEHNDFYYMVITATLVPVIEELIFRLPLTSAKWTYIIFILFGLYIINDILGYLNLTMEYQHLLFGFVVVMTLVILSLIEPNMNQKLFWKRHYSKFFYLMTILFAYAHIGNFNWTENNSYLLAIPLLLPQFFGGIILGYARIQYGIGYSILLHCLHNACIFFILYFFK